MFTVCALRDMRQVFWLFCVFWRSQYSRCRR